MTSSPVDFVSCCTYKSRLIRKTLTRNPVDRGGDAVLVASLERVDNAENLSRVAASAGGIGEREADGLLRIDDENTSNSEGDALLVDISGVLVVDPTVQVRQQIHQAFSGAVGQGARSHVVE